METLSDWLQVILGVVCIVQVVAIFVMWHTLRRQRTQQKREEKVRTTLGAFAQADNWGEIKVMSSRDDDLKSYPTWTKWTEHPAKVASEALKGK